MCDGTRQQSCWLPCLLYAHLCLCCDGAPAPCLIHCTPASLTIGLQGALLCKTTELTCMLWGLICDRGMTVQVGTTCHRFMRRGSAFYTVAFTTLAVACWVLTGAAAWLGMCLVPIRLAPLPTQWYLCSEFLRFIYVPLGADICTLCTVCVYCF